MTDKKVPDNDLLDDFKNENVPEGKKDDYKKKNPSDGHQKEDKKDVKKRSMLRSKIRLRRLINANASELDKFITLTFRDNITDISKANKLFEKFKKRLKYYLDDKELKYIAVIQFQERGAIHYHALLNCGYIPNKKLNRIWRHGFVRINKIDEVDNVGAYVTAYMSDEFKNIENSQRYLRSDNLKEPVVIKDDKEVAEFLHQLEDQTPDYQTEYKTEHFGKVDYRQYKT